MMIASFSSAPAEAADAQSASTGARIGALLWGAAATGLFVLLGHESNMWWIGLPVYAFVAAALVRSAWLGVWVSPGAVKVVSWFRTQRFRAGEVSAVELVPYFGMGGASVGWLPVVGSVRMIEVELTSGRRVWLPSTIGRRNGVLRLARTMRAALGLSIH